MQQLSHKENRARKGMVYEVEDFRSEECVVTCFKKVSTSNAQLRMNCFVTQFEFSRRDDAAAGEVPQQEGGVQDQLQDSDAILCKIKAELKATEDAEVAASPFVYLMNKIKYEAMAKDDDHKGEQEAVGYMSVPHRFSMFNR